MNRTLRLLLLLALLAPATGSALADSEALSKPMNRSHRFSRGVLNEGAFLADQPGRLVVLEKNIPFFVFDRNKQGRAVPPMALLPCAMLMRMEQIEAGRSEEVRFLVSGQVFRYKNRNYLLPTFYKIAPANKPQETPAPGVSDPASDPDPSVAALIGSLKVEHPGLYASDRSSFELTRSNLLADGSFLKPRRGRIIRDPSGSLAFVVDNDADKPDQPAIHMQILPGRGLTTIERLLGEHGADSVLVISGRVFQYRGRNVLAPTMVQLQLDDSSALTPAQ